MKQIKPTQPKSTWFTTYKKWSDLSLFERESFETCCHMRRKKNGTIHLSTRGKAYYRPKSRRAGEFKDIYVQPKRPAIKKRSMAFRYFIFFLKLLGLSIAVSITAGVVVGHFRAQMQTEFISPLPDGSTLETPVYKTSMIDKVEAKVEVQAEPQSVEDMIRAKFGDRSELALAIARCESTMRVDAIGDKNLNPKSYGLFQIRAFKGRPSAQELLTAEANIDYAYLLSQGGTDWSHWSCFTRGYYLKHYYL